MRKPLTWNENNHAFIVDALLNLPNREWHFAINSCGISPPTKGEKYKIFDMGDKIIYRSDDFLRVVCAFEALSYHRKDKHDNALESNKMPARTISGLIPFVDAVADFVLEVLSSPRSEQLEKRVNTRLHAFQNQMKGCAMFIRDPRCTWRVFRILFRSRLFVKACETETDFYEAEKYLYEIERWMACGIRDAENFEFAARDLLHVLGKDWPRLYRELRAKISPLLDNESKSREAFFQDFDIFLAAHILDPSATKFELPSDNKHPPLPGDSSSAVHKFSETFRAIAFVRFTKSTSPRAKQDVLEDSYKPGYFLDDDDIKCWRNRFASELLRKLMQNMYAKLFVSPTLGCLRYEQLFRELGGDCGNDSFYPLKKPAEATTPPPAAAAERPIGTVAGTTTAAPVVLLCCVNSDPRPSPPDSVMRFPLPIRIFMQTHWPYCSVIPVSYYTTMKDFEDIAENLKRMKVKFWFAGGLGRISDMKNFLKHIPRYINVKFSQYQTLADILSLFEKMTKATRSRSSACAPPHREENCSSEKKESRSFLEAVSCAKKAMFAEYVKRKGGARSVPSLTLEEKENLKKMTGINFQKDVRTVVFSKFEIPGLKALEKDYNLVVLPPDQDLISFFLRDECTPVNVFLYEEDASNKLRQRIWKLRRRGGTTKKSQEGYPPGTSAAGPMTFSPCFKFGSLSCNNWTFQDEETLKKHLQPTAVATIVAGVRCVIFSDIVSGLVSEEVACRLPSRHLMTPKTQELLEILEAHDVALYSFPNPNKHMMTKCKYAPFGQASGPRQLSLEMFFDETENIYSKDFHRPDDDGRLKLRNHVEAYLNSYIPSYLMTSEGRASDVVAFMTDKDCKLNRNLLRMCSCVRLTEALKPKQLCSTRCSFIRRRQCFGTGRGDDHSLCKFPACEEIPGTGVPLVCTICKTKETECRVCEERRLGKCSLKCAFSQRCQTCKEDEEKDSCFECGGRGPWRPFRPTIEGLESMNCQYVASDGEDQGTRCLERATHQIYSSVSRKMLFRQVLGGGLFCQKHAVLSRCSAENLYGLGDCEINTSPLLHREPLPSLSQPSTHWGKASNYRLCDLSQGLPLFPEPWIHESCLEVHIKIREKLKIFFEEKKLPNECRVLITRDRVVALMLEECLCTSYPDNGTEIIVLSLDLLCTLDDEALDRNLAGFPKGLRDCIREDVMCMRWHVNSDSLSADQREFGELPHDRSLVERNPFNMLDVLRANFVCHDRFEKMVEDPVKALPSQMRHLIEQRSPQILKMHVPLAEKMVQLYLTIVFVMEMGEDAEERTISYTMNSQKFEDTYSRGWCMVSAALKEADDHADKKTTTCWGDSLMKKLDLYMLQLRKVRNPPI